MTGLRLKEGVNVEELRKFGFKKGSEWAAEKERCLDNKGYEYQHNWWHKFLMRSDFFEDPDEKGVLYASEHYDQPAVHICFRFFDSGKNDLYIEVVPPVTYHFNDLEIVQTTIFDLVSAGLVEKIPEECD